MKIKLISDLHIEFQEDKRIFENPTNADVLIIAGDLDVGYERVNSALRKFRENYNQIIYVPGNHEYYRGTISEFDYYLRRSCEGTNVHFLNPGYATLYNLGELPVTFIGGCLWTNFRNNQWSRIGASNLINDFRSIKGFSTVAAEDLYNQHLQYIQDAYNKLPGTKIIISHFLPAVECIHPRYVGEGAINDYFASDNANWIANLTDVPYWFFGHTHDHIDVTIGDTRLVANPYGYRKLDEYNQFEVIVNE